MKTPSFLPIQFSCISFVFSGQSRFLSPSRSFCAYLVIRKYHCVSGFCTTSVSQRSHLPSHTCSFASTVWQLGQKFTFPFLRYARSFFSISRNSHCVQW